MTLFDTMFCANNCRQMLSEMICSKENKGLILKMHLLKYY